MMSSTEAFFGKIDCLRDRSGDEWLSRRHHAEMAHVVNRARALRRLERAIEDGEVIVLDDAARLRWCQSRRCS